MNYFEVLNSFWENSYNKLSNKEKDDNYFIINRRLSINYPIQSAYLSQYGICKYAVVDFWRNFITKYNSKPPYWLYITKNNIKNKIVKNKNLNNFSDEILFRYTKANKIDLKNLKQIYDLYTDKIYDDIVIFEKNVNI